MVLGDFLPRRITRSDAFGFIASDSRLRGILGSQPAMGHNRDGRRLRKETQETIMQQTSQRQWARADSRASAPGGCLCSQGALGEAVALIGRPIDKRRMLRILTSTVFNAPAYKILAA